MMCAIIIYVKPLQRSTLYVHMYTLPLAAVKSGRSEIVASDERNDDKVECSSALSIDNGSTVAIVELEVVDAFSNAVGRISKNYVYKYI